MDIILDSVIKPIHTGGGGGGFLGAPPQKKK